MCKRILSASVSVQEGTPSLEFQFHPGINLLWGQNAEDVVLTLAGIFGGMPPLNGNAEIRWNTDTSLFVSITDGACGVEGMKSECADPPRIVKVFHKQRFLNFRKTAHVLDGARLPAGTSGASDLSMEKLRAVLAAKDGRPLFLYSFLERLDEAADLRSIFKALLATGRQIFIAVPHYYQIKPLEEMPYVTIIHTP